MPNDWRSKEEEEKTEVEVEELELGVSLGSSVIIDTQIRTEISWSPVNMDVDVDVPIFWPRLLDLVKRGLKLNGLQP
ncbi:GD16159 [Drosophila simulans]|uniref:GD16159 n=1 Tax=Drosophila simulans TaxID=7240 RepID=B4R5Y3_DROSI|nr:GD16159 [Drosophila simulans]